MVYKANIASAYMEFTSWQKKEAKEKITNGYKTANHAKSNEEIVLGAKRQCKEEQFLGGVACVQGKYLQGSPVSRDSKHEQELIRWGVKERASQIEGTACLKAYILESLHEFEKLKL